jgi:superfamily II DNA helicase RecQ
MSRRNKVNFSLRDTSNIDKPSDEEIAKILRAADMIIDVAGRNALVKILKGSKDKKILEHKFDECPSYGYYNHLKMADIKVIVDWMIENGYLDISYNGRLPMIIFSDYGWELYKPIFAKEVLDKLITVPDENIEELAEYLRTINRQVINIILEWIVEKDLKELIPFLRKWVKTAYKKDAQNIRKTISKLSEK